MTSPTLLTIGQFPPSMQRVVDAEFDAHDEAAVQGSAALQGAVRAILTRSNYRVDAAWLDRLPKLAVIATSGVGHDGIPVAAARERGVVVTNTPGLLDAAVAELAIGLLLALLRRIPAADRFVREGGWRDGLFPLSSGLSGKRVGIVGLGRIGTGIARRLAGFEVEIAYTGTAPKPAAGLPFVASVGALADRSDVLIVCCRGGESTRGLVDAGVLARLGADGVLVNVARGTVVDEVALVAALASGTIRGAALDVFADEPLGDSPLRTLPNVVLSPHAGSATEETRRVMLRLALDNIHRVLAGEPALTPV
jgi:lactate dehydrogenase-like 2-hydroxyacid dehydrogenase